MRIHLNLGNKLALIMITLSMVVIAILSFLFMVQFDSALKERVLLQLSSVKHLKIFKIESEIHERVLSFENQIKNHLSGLPFDTTVFIHFASLDQLPSKIIGFGIPSVDLAAEPGVRMIDLTLDNSNKCMTIGILKQVDNKVFIGISEIREIQEILFQRTGLGETGESYLVGDDYLMRTKSRFFEGIPWVIEVKSEGVINALKGKHGEGIFKDYRNVEVFSSYAPMYFYGLNWAILTEMDHQEALFPLAKLRSNLIFIFILVTLFIFIVSYLLASFFVSPIVVMNQKLITMSQGGLEGISTSEKRSDEIGRMFEALNRLVAALNGMISFAGKIGSGDFDAEYHILSETDKLGKALVRMKEQLKEFKTNEQRLITENQRSILDGQEQERTRLAREMHDGLGPLLTTMRFDIQAADFDKKKQSALLHRLDETINEVRRMSNNLMPSVLTDFGVGEAIGNLINQINANIPIDIQYKNDMSPNSAIDDSVHIALYRIVQEAINNALKHASASEIKISLTEFKNYLGLFIADNGVGYDTSKHHIGNGLRNMKERVKLLSGFIEIDSSKRGTTIEVEIPIK